MNWFTTARAALPSEAVRTHATSDAVHRSRIARIVVFGGVVLATLSVAGRATAWPMCGT